MKDILRELNNTISAKGSMVMASDGVLIASDMRDGTDVERLAALGAAIITDVGASLRDAGFNGFSSVEVAAERGKVILTDAGDLYLLVMVGARFEIGPGTIEIESAARKLERASGLAMN